MPVLYCLAIFSLTNEGLEKVRKSDSLTHARRIARMRRMKIELTDILTLGYDPDPGSQRRPDEIASLEHVQVNRVRMVCACNDNDWFEGLHFEMSDGEILTQAILTARAINISLSVTIHLNQCQTRASTFEITPMFDFSIKYWMEHSSAGSIHVYARGLQGQTKYSIDQEIERHTDVSRTM
ncbi:MAG: hypothetical protein GOMPHAMPRED_005183 [Gomphillus americanus]|uniref:Uncharacterized protein n=1 Tax=Gomphillus americanus TaxID=1940652 RepID=A0A8H3FPW3_9LECA|nr:MAG: hypothetical protein GOMPHAMPRED_005183 [Gomphillus americanus]